MGRSTRVTLVFMLVSASIILASGIALAATIVGDNNANTITGTADPDTLLGYGGDDTITGLQGTDTVTGGDGNDTLYGSDSLTRLADVEGNVISGQSGDDTIVGGGGADTLSGGLGADLIVEGQEDDRGLDTISGGDGNDTILAVSYPAREDRVSCGSGIDRVRADSLDDISSDCEYVTVSAATSLDPDNVPAEEELSTEQNFLTEAEAAAEDKNAMATGEGEYQTLASPASHDTYAFWSTNKGNKRVRWGTDRWGYRHVRDKHGWFPDSIKRTINENHFYERQGTTDVYQRIVRETANAQYLHKVVYQNSNFSDGRDQGLITAYVWRKPKCSTSC